VNLDRREVKVRSTGVDAPESVDPSKPVERFARESAAFLRRLVEGKRVRLAYEPAGARLDKYGRKPAYPYLEPGGLLVNREIVAQGSVARTLSSRSSAWIIRARQSGKRSRTCWDSGDRTGRLRTPTSSGLSTSKGLGQKNHRRGRKALGNSAAEVRLADVGTKYRPCAVYASPSRP
jgi:hypothetical protein